MKIIFFLLSFVFVSCVTANTGKRDLSGINEKPAQEQTLIEDKKRPLMLVDDYDECMIDCTANGGSTRGCHCVCGWHVGGCNSYFQSPKDSKKPLMLADYATCMHACERDSGCHRTKYGKYRCSGSDLDNCHEACRTQ